MTQEDYTREQFVRCARATRNLPKFLLAHCECVLKDSWRLKPQDPPAEVHGLAIGPRAHSCEHAAQFKVRLKLSAREVNPVRLPRHQASPHLLLRGADI